MAELLKTTTCVIGGGPAGMMCGLLLARAGVEVVVLEKHKDFFRDFRGDTIHPSTLELMQELGWLDDLLAQPHQKIDHLSANFAGEEFPLGDIRHVPTTAKFIALMPQWDFLNFLAEKAKAFPTFRLLMEHEATSLIESNGRVVGVHAKTPKGFVDIHATLTVGCDGRHATSREAAHLNVTERGVPIDVLWFRVSRKPEDPEYGLGYITAGHLIVLIPRADYFQVGYIIRKGDFPAIQQAGLEAFRESFGKAVPFFAKADAQGHRRVDEVKSLDDLKLLTVQINHLNRWHRDGLLCIGDAAHAMSPVGGIGINLAIQDAVAAANILAKPLLVASAVRPVPEATLAEVQKRRGWAVRVTQFFQAMAHKGLQRILGAKGPVKAPWILRVVSRTPMLQRFMGRAIGVGVLPEHVHTADVFSAR